MPYIIFALKWRPKNFDELVGQPHIVATLKASLQKNRLTHAYLFAGPRGVGKTSAARILAKALNCKTGPTAKPCDKCPACIEINEARSLDVIEVDGASNRGIDEIRALRENVKFSPASGRYKIYIIDEVHMLTPEAFNALLKTLEEPPEFVHFIFATTQPQKVLPTILSRCQRFDFHRIPLLGIISQLEKISQAENIQIARDVLFAIARASDGSLRDAETILDQLVSFSQGSLSLEDAVSVLGLVEQEALFGLTEAITHKDPKAALGLLNTIFEEGRDPAVFLTNLIEHFRNLMVAKITHADIKLLDLPQDICDRLLQQAKSFSLEEIFGAFNILVNTQEMTKRLESARIPLEISLVKLSHDKRSAGADKPASTVSPQPYAPVKEKPALPEEKKESPAQNPAVCAPSFSLEQIATFWQNAIESLSRIKMSVATYMKEGIPEKLENNTLTVSFPKELSLHKEALESKENKAIIETAVSGLFNTKLKINFILSVQQRPPSADSAFIKSALDTFSARVIREE